MLKLLEWAIPLLVSVLLIQGVSEVLYIRAIEYRPAGSDDPGSNRQQLPVHVIDREATSGSIIT
jgi:hypothetical protein